MLSSARFAAAENAAAARRYSLAHTCIAQSFVDSLQAFAAESARDLRRHRSCVDRAGGLLVGELLRRPVERPLRVRPAPFRSFPARKKCRDSRPPVSSGSNSASNRSATARVQRSSRPERQTRVRGVAHDRCGGTAGSPHRRRRRTRRGAPTSRRREPARSASSTSARNRRWNVVPEHRGSPHERAVGRREGVDPRHRSRLDRLGQHRARGDDLRPGRARTAGSRPSGPPRARHRAAAAALPRSPPRPAR